MLIRLVWAPHLFWTSDSSLAEWRDGTGVRQFLLAFPALTLNHAPYYLLKELGKHDKVLETFPPNKL